MLIQISEETPLVVPPIGGGEYVVEVRGWEVIPSADGKPQTTNVQINFTIKSGRDGNSDIPDKGRFVSDTVWDVSQNNSKTKLRQIFTAAGLPSTGDLDLSNLVGKTLPVLVTQRSYTDKTTKEQKIAANVSRYLIDAEVLAADKAKHQPAVLA